MSDFDALSPAAQAVMDAYGEEVGGILAITSYERRAIAAALRAAAEHAPEPNDNYNAYEAGYWDAIGYVERLAAELSNDPTTTETTDD